MHIQFLNDHQVGKTWKTVKRPWARDKDGTEQNQGQYEIDTRSSLTWSGRQRQCMDFEVRDGLRGREGRGCCGLHIQTFWARMEKKGRWMHRSVYVLVEKKNKRILVYIIICELTFPMWQTRNTFTYAGHFKKTVKTGITKRVIFKAGFHLWHILNLRLCFWSSILILSVFSCTKLHNVH